MNENLPEPAWQTITINPRSIKRDARFQPRHDLDEATVAQYAFAMRRGDSFPPVKLAVIGGGFMLVDGFHRVAAAEKAGLNEISAEAAKMSKEEAIRQAIVANAKHGLPMRRKDKYRAFELYRDGNLHRGPKGVVKSLRRICAELGGIVWPNTVRKWLRASGIEVVEDAPTDRSRWQEPEVVPDPELILEIDTLLAQVEMLVGSIESLEVQKSAVWNVRQLLHRLDPPYLDI